MVGPQHAPVLVGEPCRRRATPRPREPFPPCRPGARAPSRRSRFDGVALGYLAADGLRTNVLHLPVRGSGDGGIYTTAADLSALWSALYAGRIVPADAVAYLTRPHSDVPAEQARYGLGFWLHPTGTAVRLVGGDAGVSFRSVHDETEGVTHTVLSNTTDGAWAVSRRLSELLGA